MECFEEDFFHTWEVFLWIFYSKPKNNCLGIWQLRVDLGCSDHNMDPEASEYANRVTSARVWGRSSQTLPEGIQ